MARSASERPVSGQAGSPAPSARVSWCDGWLEGARRIESPNCGPRPEGVSIDLALVHSISLPPGHYGGDAIERLFTNRLDWDAHPYYALIRGFRVSAHFLVRRDGELLQFVSCDARAWHAGASAWRGRSDCNDFSIGIELEGLEGEGFETPQYGTLAGLVQRVAQRYPIAAVVGHEHVAPGRKHDPGAGFEWPRFAALLRPFAPDFPEGAVETERAPPRG
ncbi:MAG: 1,6-anhydro-N-acetylmuramyl-L-alanine amidase AmpD [Rhizobiales bacterium]|nr:1,6-anhydro-N-acetylmuramyl-L-alanine amidase AmpD [Rhizobacter sp.]